MTERNNEGDEGFEARGGRAQRKTRMGGRQRTCARVLYIPQTDRQTDSTGPSNTPMTAAKQKKTPWENDAAIKTPLGWPWVPIMD